MKQGMKTFRWGSTIALACAALVGLVTACNTHPVEIALATDRVSVNKDKSVDAAAEVDILWVIDNSGSMCDAQESLRSNFDAFIDEIANRNIDFHIGVTTTHMDAISQEKVARPGHLQSMPQPDPAVNEKCVGEPGTSASGTDGYSAFRQNLELAVSCTKSPSEWEHLLDVTNEEIECHLNQDCNGEDAASWELFPTASDGTQPYGGMPKADSPYKDIPKVLRADDYRTSDGAIDVAKLEQDFACMSMVGTRGYWVEKGLSAAKKAVSPDMTGGPYDPESDNPPDAPNHGLLRQNSNFAMIFVTDENDCSHDGSLDEGTACGDSVCEFAQNPNLQDSPMLSTEKLADDFLENLRESKARDDNFDGDGIVLASFHGRWKRFGEDTDYPEGQPMRPEECTPDLTAEPAEEKLKAHSCQTQWGAAFSGDRYDRWLRNFPQANIFPKPDSDPNKPLDGLMCAPENIPGELKDLGDTIAGSVSECITDVPYECEQADECPDFMFGGGTPSCVQFGQSDQSYCESGVQVRLYPAEGSEKTADDVEAHPYCIPDSFNSSVTPGGCVISRDRYSLETCGGLDSAIDLVWSSDTPYEDLIGYEVEMVYALVPREDDSDNSAANNSTANNSSADAGN
jgi:hypothetical protein